MAAPTSYTESTLATFMLACLKDMATALGWTALSDIQEAVNETLLAYGVTGIADATDIRKLRMLARREVWRLVCAATSGDYDVNADGADMSRSQMHAMAEKEFQAASAEAAPYDSANSFAAVVQPIEYEHDPYGPEALNGYQDW